MVYIELRRHEGEGERGAIQGDAEFWNVLKVNTSLWFFKLFSLPYFSSNKFLHEWLCGFRFCRSMKVLRWRAIFLIRYKVLIWRSYSRFVSVTLHILMNVRVQLLVQCHVQLWCMMFQNREIIWNFRKFWGAQDRLLPYTWTLAVLGKYLRMHAAPCN